MKLLNVEVVLNRQKDIQRAESERDILEEHDDNTTSYAILSHRWGVEVTYEEMIGLMTLEDRKKDEVWSRYGYQKIIKSCKQAKEDGYKWLWIDTCCIDKRSSAELSEAINAMYRWYQNAQVCYAYLNDVDELVLPTERDHSKFAKSNGWPEWYMRGWTLQELIAPKRVEFFNKDWVHIGNKQRFAPTLAGITGIPRKVLTSGLAGKRLSVAQIMSWAAQRKTTRVEDRAYSLMGLFGVKMPMLYGEGKNAFRRLQLEIIKETSDHSIFAWDPWMPRTGSVLAEDPRDFLACGGIRKVEPDEFVDRLVEYIERHELGNPRHINDILGRDRRARQRKLTALRDAAHSQQFHTFTISNTGIQVCLPVIPDPEWPSQFRAILPCTTGSLFGLRLVTVDLVSSGSSFDRIHIDSTFTRYAEFKTLHLTHHQDVNEKCREFTLDDKHVAYHGFTRCGTYPHEFGGNAVTLSSLTDGLIVIVYANNDARSRFAVGLGYHRGQGWVHIVCDERFPAQEVDGTDFGCSAYHRIRNARAEYAQSMPKRERVHHNDHFTKHAHLPRSIWAARVVWGRWDLDDFKVMVDIEQCPGCCDGPYRWTTTDNDRSDIGVPWLMKTVRGWHSLRLDGWEARFEKCSGQRVALGDYGDYSDGVLIRAGNIFEDMRTLGINPEDSTYCLVVSRVSDGERRIRYMRNQDNVAVAHDAIMARRLALRQPKGISLPANDSIVLLLKALSIRLAGKHLVTTIIQCSEFYEVDEDGKRCDSGDDLVSDSVGPSTEAGMLTPLCTIATPQVWRRHLACVQRRERFKSIREHFYALVNMRQLAGTEAHRKSVNKRKKDGAIKFFSDLFGLKYLRNYIGEITLFERLPSMIEADSLIEGSVGTAEEDSLLAHPPKLMYTNWVMICNLFNGRQQSNADEDSRLEVVLPLLRRRFQNLSVERDAPRRYADEKKKVVREAESILQTLGSGLPKYIAITFLKAYWEHDPPAGPTLQASKIDYNRQLDTPSIVQEIEALQAKLNETVDEDEQRALEEDVTGKARTASSCYLSMLRIVHSLIDPVALLVVDYLRREANSGGLMNMFLATPSTTSADPGDDQTHLQRIMHDAGAGTSKHELLLASRDAERVKWSGTNRGAAAIENEGTTPSTSSQTPSTPVV
ncbi:hypothetical protein EDC04DRAFT_2896023 [Pisolithus marmoratus]|nr:hypothetical protein EDC04DRAFT_2896023 [Pisolithus marmoratus]